MLENQKNRNLNSTFFSFIIPVYNVGKYIDECLNSILTQSFTDFEIILVNDGSTDESGEICDKYAKDYGCIEVIHKNNAGTASARNAGMAIATGKYLWFVDSDDMILEHALSKLYELIQSNENIPVLNFTKKDFKDGELPNRTISFYQSSNKIVQIVGKSLERMPSSVCFSLYSKEFLIDLKMKFNENNEYEDEYFNLQLYTNYEFSNLYVEFPFYLYRRRIENSKSSTNHNEIIFKKCVSQIELFIYASRIKKEDSNEDWLSYKRRVYAEKGLVLFECYLKGNNLKCEKEIKKVLKNNIPFIPIKGKWFKNSQLKRLLYNISVDLFVFYVKLNMILNSCFCSNR